MLGPSGSSASPDCPPGDKCAEVKHIWLLLIEGMHDVREAHNAALLLCITGLLWEYHLVRTMFSYLHDLILVGMCAFVASINLQCVCCLLLQVTCVYAYHH